MSKCRKNTYFNIVTIDGPSASGKSTIARLIAKKLKYEHLDTGAIYRAIALWVSRQGYDETNQEEFVPRLDKIDYRVVNKGPLRQHLLSGKVVNNELRTKEISQLASKLAVIKEVRNVATNLQREIAKDKNIVVEGRDAGTAVFPGATVKIYLTAKMEERAKRRLEELKKKFPDQELDLTLEETMKELSERDERDRNRDNSPMKRAVDAFNVDTTGKTIKEVIKETVTLIKRRRVRKPNPIWSFLIGEERASTTLVYKCVYLFSWCVYRLFYRIKVYGLDNFPLNDKVATIVAPNHVSYLDPPAVGLACPCELHAMAIDYLFKFPLFGYVFPKINVHPVSNDVSDAKVIRMIVSLLKGRNNVLIFPEGTRSLDNKILPLKRGVAVLATLTGCSITPTYIDGVHKAWPRKNAIPKPWGKISVVFGKPLYIKEYQERGLSKREAEKAILDDLKAAIEDLQKNFKRS